MHRERGYGPGVPAAAPLLRAWADAEADAWRAGLKAEAARRAEAEQRAVAMAALVASAAKPQGPQKYNTIQPVVPTPPST